VTSKDVPENARALLRDHVESYEQLEVLLLLRAEVGVPWTPDAVAERLRIDMGSAESALQHLATHGLVELQRQTGVTDRFCYKPQTSALATAAAALAQAYEERRAAVMALLSANAIERVRASVLHTFAEAFRLRKRKPDG
jgi:predicted transcriptional regulator